MNLHPGLASARRQHYFILNLLAKYSSALDDEMHYAGHPNTRSEVREYVYPDKSVPKPLQKHAYICHGKTLIKVSNNYIEFSGNESLVKGNGWGVGTFVLLNNGKMTHSDRFSKYGGLSKGISMAAALLVAPLNYYKKMDFSLAFYALNIMDIPKLHLKMLRQMFHTSQDSFWVSEGRFGYFLG